MTGFPQIELTEEQQEEVGRFRRELHELTDRMMSGATGVGANITKEIMAQELGYVQNIETNTLTIGMYLQSWLKQFRLNLLRTHGFGETNLPKRCRKSAIVVGAGPSLTDEQLESLRDYQGYLICSNKVLERVSEYRLPNMVAVIHTTHEIAANFQSYVVRVNLGQSDVVVSTCVHPDVTQELCVHATKDKIHWFNASIPFKKNLDDYMQAMAPGLLQIDTGGNVGIFMCELAETMGYDTIGLLGMEHCLKLDPKWTNEQASEYAIYYAPEDDPEPFAMNQAFTAYMQTLQAWYILAVGHAVYNLTPRGFLYTRRRLPGGMPYMDLKEYVGKFK